VRRETGTVTAYDKKGTITRRFVPGAAGGDASDIKLELDAHLSFVYEIAAKRPTLTVAIAGVRQAFVPGEMLKLKREGNNTAPAPGTPSEYVVPPRAGGGGGGKKGGKSPGALSPREAAAPPVEEAEGGGCC
jgi:hypothetical protein